MRRSPRSQQLEISNSACTSSSAAISGIDLQQPEARPPFGGTCNVQLNGDFYFGCRRRNVVAAQIFEGLPELNLLAGRAVNLRCCQHGMRHVLWTEPVRAPSEAGGGSHELLDQFSACPPWLRPSFLVSRLSAFKLCCRPRTLRLLALEPTAFALRQQIVACVSWLYVRTLRPFGPAWTTRSKKDNCMCFLLT